jgi:DNA repair protein RecO (recombination protein O)
MLQQTQGIVLRSVRYGETSLITHIFTRTYGVQTYMVQGVRKAGVKGNKAGLLQPASLLDLVVYQKPFGNMQRIKEYQFAWIYTSLQEEIVRNSIALFSVEVLYRLLPEHAPMSDLYDFAADYFQQLDKMPVPAVANFPLFFVIQCSRFLGYEIRGNYTAATPFLNLQEGAYTDHPPLAAPFVTHEEALLLDRLLQVNNFEDLETVALNATMRFNLLDWYLAFLHRHTQHMGVIRSLDVLRTILH